MKRLISLLLILVLTLGCFAGCGGTVGSTMGDIAGNVAEAAKKELESQVKLTFEKYKVTVLDLKSATGKLNGSEDVTQFFCAALVESDSEAIPQSVADALGKVFHDAGIHVQTGAAIESRWLEHKELSFNSEKFEEGKTYYAVWCYTDKLPDLSDLKDMITTEGNN